MQLQTKIAHNTIIQVASKVISTALGLVAIALITRYLGATGFGEYTTIVTFISFFAIIADFGLTLITVQMISLPGISEKKVLDNLFALRLVSAVIFLSLGPAIVWFFPYDHMIKVGVLILALSFLFIALNQILVGLFQKRLRMDKVSISEVVGRIFLVIGVWLAVKNNLGLNSILWTTVVASFVNFLLHFVFSRKFAKISLECDWSLWKKIIKKSWPLAIIIVFNLIYLKADTLILSLVQPQAEVGLYGAAYKVIDVLITVPFMFAGLVLPFLTSHWAKKETSAFKHVLQKSFDFMSILAIPIVFGVVILAPQIIQLIAGNKFAQSAMILRILILAAFMIFLGTLFSHAIIAMNKQRKLIPLYLFTSLTALVGYLIFIPKYSYIGAAWMTIYSETMVAALSGYYIYKFAKFIPQAKVFFKAILSALIMSGVLLLIPASFTFNWLGLLATILIACLVYFTTLYLFKGISRQDLASLKTK